MTHIVSFSELDTFRQCPLKHELAYKERWTRETTSPALKKGSLWHAVMEAHYKALKEGQPPEAANKAAYAAMHEFAPDDETKDLIMWMYDGYLEQWSYDSNWKIVAVEHAAEIWLPTATGGRSGFKLKMKIDLIVEDERDRTWLTDHKSGARLPYGKDLDMDDQFALYSWGMGKLGLRAFGQLYNAARTQRNKGEMQLEDRFSRTMMARTERELECVAEEAWRTAKRAYAIKPGQAERATDSDRCNWRCDFREACLWGRKKQNGTRDFLVDTGFIQNFTRH